LRWRDETREDPPKEDNDALVKTTTRDDGVRPLTKDSGGEPAPPLGIRRRELNLQELQMPPPTNFLQPVNSFLSLAAMAGREKAEDQGRNQWATAALGRKTRQQGNLRLPPPQN
jgi:hypothetical protein